MTGLKSTLKIGAMTRAGEDVQYGSPGALTEFERIACATPWVAMSPSCKDRDAAALTHARLPTIVRNNVSQRPGALTEVAGLARSAGAALGRIPGWLWGPAVGGWPRLRSPAPFSEYGLFVSPDVPRTIRFLGDVLVPSLPGRAPAKRAA